MTIRIADLPARERPRERLMHRGVDALSERELLALVLRNGRRGESAVDLAGVLLADHGGLAGLATARPEELARHPGIGAAKAAAVVAALRLARLLDRAVDRPVLRSGEDVARAAGTELTDARNEILVVLICDGANRLVTTTTVALGAADRVALPVREILNAVLRHDGRSFAVAHNHPSGDATPSDADRRATDRLATAAQTVGLRFLDHVVIGHARTWESATPRPRTHNSRSSA